jgi:hypothetical protein
MKAVLLLLLVVGTAVFARDYRQYEHAPAEIRQWFRDLRSPDGVSCCEVTDCRRTEAHLSEGRWQARAPDGSWVAVPRGRVIHDRGNPIGEPILCATQEDGTWLVFCFVPGALL